MINSAPALAPLPARPFDRRPLYAAALLGLFYAAVQDLELDFASLAWGLSDLGGYLARFLDPDFEDLPRYGRLMAETLAISLWGTALAVAVAFLAAPLAARNLSPHPLVYRLVREALNFARAMPDLLLALIFVAALGLGPLPGVLALGLHTAGFLGKFLAECLERVDAGAYEAARATGAGGAQIVMWAGWPSILPEAVGYAVYILDRNVRMAAVLGLVGAGGIGLALHDTLRIFEYGRASALVIVVFGTIVAIDASSSFLRSRIR